ncbi:MAG: hypothetical protein WCQ64_13075, partial [Acidobacteriota bacterium]
MKYAAAALLVVLLGLSGRMINYPHLAGGFKGDEATYVLMSLSFAHDFDMKYQSRDLVRFYNLHRDGDQPNGVAPEGLFIKKGSRIVGWKWAAKPSLTAPIEFIREEIPTTQSIEYGKAFAYPLFAAPFVWLGGLGGMFMFNVLLLIACAVLGARFGRARTGSRAGAAFGVAFVVASVMPVWTAWLTPEVFNFSLVFFAYFLWLYKEVAPVSAQPTWWRGPSSDLVAALLIGIVTFSKLNHALMIAPLGLLALSRLQLKRTVLIGVFFVLGAGGCYGANLLSTGEANYQGSAYVDGRISCYGDFPFDGKGTPFGVSQQCGSKVTNDANDEQIVQMGIVPTHAMLGTFIRNAYYFVVGRDAGLLPYFFPGFFAVVLLLLRFWEARSWQWLTLGAVAAQAWVFLALAPWSWNGDGGPPGNRYFLSIYPAMLFLLPASARWGSAALGLVGGIVFTGAMNMTPFVSAKDTWLAVRKQPLKSLPVEKTIMNALPVRLLDNTRARIKWHTKTYVQFYFMDDNTYDVEEPGVWMRGASTADIIVKAEFPLTRIAFTVHAPIDNAFTMQMASTRWSVSLQKDVPQTFEFAPGNGVWSKDGYVYEMKWTCTKGFVPSQVDPKSADSRFLG